MWKVIVWLSGGAVSADHALVAKFRFSKAAFAARDFFRERGAQAEVVNDVDGGTAGIVQVEDRR
jgi:hypothetical protein